MTYKKLIGYKLNGTVTAKQVADLMDISSEEKDGLFFWESLEESKLIKNLQSTGLLAQWFDAVYEEDEIKIGDLVITTTAIDNSYSKPNIGEIFKVTKVKDNDVYFEPWNSVNINRVRKATPNEVEKYLEVEIDDYEAEVINGKIAFGCQEFDKDELLNLQKFLNRNEINPEIIVRGMHITSEMIEKLLMKL